ncbi:hypothetical protein ACIQAL_09990 [Pseudomonas sp. NPDC088368]|uniref:hypothetical protein n=1 Tax=Pseudomonas sp. NPDC088368 TaxID=3364453 RepID=UPI00380449E6
MTDLSEPSTENEITFGKLLALKAELQHQKKDNLREWNRWYSALDEETRKAVDEEIAKFCDSIRSQFGKSQRFQPRKK